MTNEMHPGLRAELTRRGWNPDKVIWGRRVEGDMHGMSLEQKGVIEYYPGPFVAIGYGGQSAIVRWR
jgi:hypothetical protein